MSTWRDEYGNKVEADTADEAIELLRYEDEPGWWECSVTCVETGEFAYEVYYIEEPEPPCERKAHRWDSPIDVVGGCAQNPGVFGHGGGVYIVEVCAHCGCKRTIDTWAQCPLNGTQGHTIVTYSDGYDDDRDE